MTRYSCTIFFFHLFLMKKTTKLNTPKTSKNVYNLFDKIKNIISYNWNKFIQSHVIYVEYNENVSESMSDRTRNGILSVIEKTVKNPKDEVNWLTIFYMYECICAIEITYHINVPYLLLVKIFHSPIKLFSFRISKT